jgi:hypothetical protein
MGIKAKYTAHGSPVKLTSRKVSRAMIKIRLRNPLKVMILADQSSEAGHHRGTEDRETDELEALAHGTGVGNGDRRWCGWRIAAGAGREGQRRDQGGERNQKPFPIPPARESPGGREQRLAGVRVVSVEMWDHVGLVWDWGLEMKQPARNEPGGLLGLGRGKALCLGQILMTQGEGKLTAPANPMAAAFHRHQRIPL